LLIMAILLHLHIARSKAGCAFAKLAQLLRRSRALASMLPSLSLSVMLTLTLTLTLTATALMCSIESGSGKDVFGVWMEAWLISWPIAFPLVYLLSLLLRRFAVSRRIVLS